MGMRLGGKYTITELGSLKIVFEQKKTDNYRNRMKIRATEGKGLQAHFQRKCTEQYSSSLYKVHVSWLLTSHSTGICTSTCNNYM